MAEDLSIQFSYVLNYFTDHVVARFHLMDYASHVHTTFGSMKLKLIINCQLIIVLIGDTRGKCTFSRENLHTCVCVIQELENGNLTFCLPEISKVEST